jgi:hypothetical protein
MSTEERVGPPLLSQKEGAIWLTTQIRCGAVFSSGKLGSTETSALNFYLNFRKEKDVKKMYQSYILQQMTHVSGFFHTSDLTLADAIDEWAEYMLTEVLPNMDSLAEWYKPEMEILNSFAPRSIRFPARSLEPYYEEEVENRWTHKIQPGTKVAIISSFYESIESQSKNLGAAWPHTPVWNSETTIIPIKAHYNANVSPEKTWPSEILEGGWRSAVNYITNTVVVNDCQIALVGLGALSLPIVYELKKRGITAIHTGGATQIFFGIKGKRWMSHAIISTFFNDAWVMPLPSETPSNKQTAENGCYW